jgi:hypothetical protein
MSEEWTAEHGMERAVPPRLSLAEVDLLLAALIGDGLSVPPKLSLGVHRALPW